MDIWSENSDNTVMEKYDSFDIVMKALKAGEIVKIHRPQGVYFALKGEVIHAKNDQAQYVLSLQDFSALFQEAEFYRHERIEEGQIDKAKDEEYYQWKHK